MTTYVTKDGDQIDAITYQYYDGLPGAYEAVLKVNRGLSAQPHPLQAGISIELPLLSPAGEEAEISLWD
ncbi:tail protein X [Vibrio mangrovi]|uniref:Tail protein X n=1 Tax=Vibrio mangrovi TaxID=474394 RepID=A0A1Y6ITN8_9VIBR|nr:tail protein X [Vibrio mangrovi]MDW6004707.1 tail protein X [Vibrio mangrovi]SMS00998.1 Phage Tail Protein X [Vibrio mangrovi]